MSFVMKVILSSTTVKNLNKFNFGPVPTSILLALDVIKIFPHEA